MKNYLYFASITLNLCPISIAKMCFVHFRYMYNCRRTCHATMGPQLSWSSIACFYYRILRFMPGPSVGPNINLNDFMTVMDYSRALSCTASSWTDLEDARFWIGSKNIWDARFCTFLHVFAHFCTFFGKWELEMHVFW